MVLRTLSLLLLFALSVCGQEGARTVTILQLNDVYEISPLEGGRVGGLARVASLRARLLEEDRNTLTVLAGDFLSPSVIGTLRDADGERIRGAQMVDVLNHVGLDLVTFGNHEFDYGEQALLDRLSESRFGWLSANVLHRSDGAVAAFRDGSGAPVPTALIQTLETANGPLRIGWIGVTLPANKVDWVVYLDMYAAAEAAYEAIADDCDLVFGLTHLDMDQDIELARRIPGLALILGGHEHTNRVARVGDCLVAKADANAKTAYVHRIAFDPATGASEVSSELLPIDSNLPSDPAVQSVIDGWEKVADEAFARMGVDPDEIVGRTMVPLDAREVTLRYSATNLGQHVARAILRAAPNATAAFVNSGAIRLDDQLLGDIRQYDILRTLPFGGTVVTAEMSGTLLVRTLETAHVENYGLGGFPQLANLRRTDSGWLLGGEPIDPAQSYTVATLEFLMQGRESNLEFLAGQPYTPVPEDRRDIRTAVSEYFADGGLDEPLE